MTPTTQTDERAEQILQQVEQAYGFRPNLIEELVTSPAAAQVYLGGQKAMEEASLDDAERNAVMLAVSTRNECHYCTAAHAGIGRQAGLTEAQVDAILEQEELEDDRLAALVDATDRVLEKEGWLEEDDLAELERRAVDRAQLYEIVALVGLKTISNYVNHIAGTEIDPQFGG